MCTRTRSGVGDRVENKSKKENEKRTDDDVGKRCDAKPKTQDSYRKRARKEDEK